MLTARERAVLLGVVRHLSNAEAGHPPDMREGIVKAHVSSILNKLGLINRGQAAILAHDAGWVPGDDRPRADPRAPEGDRRHARTHGTQPALPGAEPQAAGRGAGRGRRLGAVRVTDRGTDPRGTGSPRRHERPPRHRRRPPGAVYPDAVAATEHAFPMLERGLGDLLRRPETSVPPVGAD
ncbi:LuxR C-terminal-related transcriptional regulator [Streptomyces sp. TRM70350]|nr:LuxR C-terminal-related transcriptional regulator [Streptomyces sp. TRM70350]